MEEDRKGGEKGCGTLCSPFSLLPGSIVLCIPAVPHCLCEATEPQLEHGLEFMDSQAMVDLLSLEVGFSAYSGKGKLPSTESSNPASRKFSLVTLLASLTEKVSLPAVIMSPCPLDKKRQKLPVPGGKDFT